MIDWSNIEIPDLVNYKENEVTDVPLKISTMTATCKLGTIINITNIEKYLELNENDVLCIKVNDLKKKTLIPEKKKNKRKVSEDTILTEKPECKHFYNQITLIIRVGYGPIIDWLTEPKINLKLFKNGSIQMSGCKSLENINKVLNKLLILLKRVKAIRKDKIIEKKYVEDINSLGINNFKINMINSNYKVNMQIDRDKLYVLLLKKKINTSYESCERACVTIKITQKNNNTLNIEQKDKISIFIFQKGNIIITGAKNKNDILYAYKYINDIFIMHSDEIYKIDEKDDELLIFKLYDLVIKENSEFI
jgi:TATA-box binding protein (TBP) (component of TFIID and TFIIIB)